MAVRVIEVYGLITAPEAAAYLGIKVRTLYGHVRRAGSTVNRPANPIPIRRVAGELRFDFHELEEWTRTYG